MLANMLWRRLEETVQNNIVALTLTFLLIGQAHADVRINGFGFYTTDEIDTRNAAMTLRTNALDARVSQLESHVSQLESHVCQLENELANNKNLMLDLRDNILRRIDAIPIEFFTNEKAYDALKDRLKQDMGKCSMPGPESSDQGKPK